MWVFNTRTTEWKHVILEGQTPEGREMAAAAVLPDSRILICGGRSAAGANLSDAFLIDFASATSRILTINPLLARCSHSAVFCEAALVRTLAQLFTNIVRITLGTMEHKLCLYRMEQSKRSTQFCSAAFLGQDSARIWCEITP